MDPSFNTERQTFPFVILRRAAWDVIRYLQTIPQLQNEKIAVVGGLAVVKHTNRHRGTGDVDFMITTPAAKQKLLEIPGTPFQQHADRFTYQLPYGPEIRIDFMQSWEVGADVQRLRATLLTSSKFPYLPDAAIPCSQVQAIPYIGLLDSLIFKMFSCGLRVLQEDNDRDADDVHELCDAILRRGDPVVLSVTRREALEGMITDYYRVLENWMRNDLGLSRR